MRIIFINIIVLLLILLLACSDPGLWGLLDQQDEIYSQGINPTDTPVPVPPEPTPTPPPDNPPRANDDNVSTQEDTAVNIDVLVNDTDPDYDTLTITNADTPDNGITAINLGHIRYTPDTNFFGTDTFSYTISDGNSTATAVVTVTVNGVNDYPVAGNDTITINEDTIANIPIMENDTDVDGDSLTIISVGPASHGTTVNNINMVTYTPDSGYHGNDSFTYTVSDGNGGSDTGSVTITISPLNDNPEGTDDTATTNEDTAVPIDVLANDTDADGDTLSLASVGNPPNGTTTINAGQVIYTPDQNFYGTDTFSYTMSDGNGGTDTAAVTVTVNGVNDFPVTFNDSITTNEDTDINIDVLENDSDVDGDALSITSVGSALHGVTAINAGQVTYTPDPGYNGPDSFTYTISDGNDGSDTGTVSVTVSPLNDAPIAGNDTTATNEDTAVNIDVLANDTDEDGDTLSIASVGAASDGTTSITIGQVTYTPDPDFHGSDTFSYTVSDGNGGIDTASVTVTINGVNDNPVAFPDFISTNEDTGVTIDVLENDTDVDGDTLSLASVGLASDGTAVINANQVVYTPDPGFNGLDSFTYTVNDGNNGTDNGTVTVTISSLNDNPIASDDTETTNEDTAVTIDVLANDTDEDGDPLNIINVGTSSNGTTAINMNQVTYTPDTDFFGIDTFTYTASDGNGGSDTALVTVTVTSVNDDPVATGDSETTNEDTGVNINVLANDTDVDGDTLSLASVGLASNGTTVINVNQVTYTPDPGFNGTDSFTYTVSDGNGGSDIGTVTVTISSLNDNPVAADDTAGTNEDSAVTINVLLNDTDEDLDPLNIISVGTSPHGTIAINMNQVTYTPDTDFFGTDTFSYTVSDGNGGSDTGNVTVTVNGVNDDPVAVGDSINTDEDTDVDINVLANDTDVDGDSLIINSVGTPANGTAVINGDRVTYTPNPGFNGTDNFSYIVSDGNGGLDTAIITVTVSSENDNPVAVDDTANTTEDSAVPIYVLANDTDDDGDTLNIASVGPASNGTTAISTDRIIYTPDPNFFGTDSFSYTISDGNGGSDTGIVTVTVIAVNDDPVAADDSTTTNEDTTVTIDALSNDTDADGDTLNITSVGAASNGTTAINLNQVTYTPNSNFNGVDSFSYTINDGNGGTDTAIITVTLIEVNDAPVAANDSTTTTEENQVNINVLDNDTDVDGDTLSITSVGSTPNGTTAININQVVYTPDTDFSGIDTFNYTVSDGNGGTDTAIITVTVIEINDAPVATDDSATANEETEVLINVLANDTDADGDTLSIVSVGTPSNGTTTIVSDEVRYTPDTDFSGIDNFSYTVSDGNGGTDTAIVTVTVQNINDNPVAADDSESTNEDTAVDIDVLANDTDADSDTLSIASVGTASNGTTTIISDEVRYTPNTDFSGIDSFSYTVSDGNGGTDIANVTVTVNEVNDEPVAAADFSTTNEDTPVLVNVLANDTDADGDTISITSVGTASDGTATIISDEVRYTPDTDFYGTDFFTYTVSDGNGGTDTATVTITVEAVNDNPVAADDSESTNEDTAVDIDVLDNDTDVDGDTLSIASVGTASNGTTTIVTGQVRYTPNTNFYGTDSFSYSVSDGNGGTDIGNVTVTVNEANDDPVAADDSATTDEDTAININVLVNDTDPDGNPLTIASVDPAANGTTSIQMGQARYTPNTDFHGTDSFSYTVSDGNGGTDTATVFVTINSVNDDPVATNDAVTMDEDTTVTIDVLDNDTDVEGDSLSILTVGEPSNGQAVISMGMIEYTPDPDYYGTDSFSYTISDGNGGTDTATVNVTINDIAEPGPPAFEETGGLVVIEAENFSSKETRNNHSWDLDTSVAGYSGSGYLVANPDDGTRYETDYAANSPVANYNINFTTPGTYYVWLRGCSPDAESDSAHIGINNTESPDSDNMTVYIGTTTWEWRKSTHDGPDATVIVTTGLHELNLWMREDGVNVDKIILTTDVEYTPSGTGPEESEITIPEYQTGQILRQKWENLTDVDTVLSLTSLSEYPDNPTSSSYLNSFEAPTDDGEGFGCRIIGYLHPSISGNYTFWLASDDNGELWLSTDSSEANKQIIASISNWTDPREWDKFPSQESASINLNAGSVYFIEAIMREAHGNDNLAVAWQPPGGSQEVIPGAYLSPYIPGSVPTLDPTSDPTLDPTSEPTLDPTSDPTLDPTSEPTPEPTPDPGPPAFQETGGLVVMEAENFFSKVDRNSHSWEPDTVVTNYSGSGYIVVNPDDETRFETNYAADSPVVNYPISFTTPGIYYVWLRACSPDAESDSVHTGIDNTESPDSDNMTMTIGTTWEWSKATFDLPDATVNITTGLHEFNIWMREDGANVDKIILTTDEGYTPSGTGPDESEITGGPEPTPEPPIGPDGYTWCADEGDSYTFTEIVDVAYGADGHFNYQYGVTGTITFDNDTFGDPIYGSTKHGYYREAEDPTADPTPEPTQAPVVPFFSETFDNVPDGTNIRPGSGDDPIGSLDNPDSFIRENFGGTVTAGTAVSGSGAITLYSSRMAFIVPGLIDATAPVLYVTIKNDDGSGDAVADLTLNVGNAVGADEPGRNAHGVYPVENTSYEILTVTLDTGALDANNLIQFRGYIGGSSTEGLHIDKIEIAESGYIPTLDPTPDPTPTPTVPAEIRIQYKCSDTTVDDNWIKPHFIIENSNTQDYPMSELTIRYYYTKEAGGTEVFTVDFAAVGSANIIGTFYDGYIEIGFTTDAGDLTIGSTSGEIQCGFHTDTWENYNESDDYSFDPAKVDFAVWENVTLYHNSTLIWGTEP